MEHGQAGCARRARTSATAATKDGYCPNHPRPKLEPASVAVGARLYCFTCAEFLARPIMLEPAAPTSEARP